MTTRTHWPVIVVGAGPTGLTTACLLARYGVDVLVIERNPSTVQEPRAVSIDDESLRTMQAAGVITEVVPEIVLGYGSEYYSPGQRKFLTVKPSSAEYGYPRRNAFRQPKLEATLRAHCMTLDSAEMWFEAELCDLAQASDGVRLSVRTAGEVRELSCDYLVGSDGGRSFVRQHLGISLEGSTFNERWLIVDLLDTIDPGRDTKVFCDPARPCLSLPGPRGTRRFEFMLHEGETDEHVLAPDFIAALLASHGESATANIQRKVVYTFHARMAERWREGRIFLAGDAAHLTPPFAGQGMNSGVRDAHNLAWKLAAVVHGRLGSGVLDTYETERRPHAAQMIELAVRLGHVMMPRTRTRAFAFEMFFRGLYFLPKLRSYFAEMKFKPKPRFAEGFLIRSDRPESVSSLVGALFPQPLVFTSCGYQLLDDVIGDGFALLAPPGTSPSWLEGPQMQKAVASLGARCIAVLDKEDATATRDPVIAVRDMRGELATFLASRPEGLYLIRPDRYVAAFFSVGQIEEAGQAIERLIASSGLPKR